MGMEIKYVFVTFPGAVPAQDTRNASGKKKNPWNEFENYILPDK